MRFSEEDKGRFFVRQCDVVKQEVAIGIAFYSREELHHPARGGEEEAAEEDCPSSLALEIEVRSRDGMGRNKLQPSWLPQPVERLTSPTPADEIAYIIAT